MIYVVTNRNPMPERINLPGRPCKYPLGKIGVGESFFVAVEYKVIAAACRSHRRRYPVKFALRKATEHGVHGVRVWRTA